MRGSEDDDGQQQPAPHASSGDREDELDEGLTVWHVVVPAVIVILMSIAFTLYPPTFPDDATLPFERSPYGADLVGDMASHVPPEVEQALAEAGVDVKALYEEIRGVRMRAFLGLLCTPHTSPRARLAPVAPLPHTRCPDSAAP